MLIKEFATKYNVSTDTVRYYEKEKLLQPRRLENGFRFYDETCERNIIFILVLKELGFKLHEIRELLRLESQPISTACNQFTFEVFNEKITNLEIKIQFLINAAQTLKVIQDLMAEGQYAQNKRKIESLMHEMYANNIVNRRD